MTWKVSLSVLVPTIISKVAVRYTTLEALEIRDTHGLHSLTTVCLVQHHGDWRSWNFSVNAIIFLAPISTFDQVLAEVSSFLPSLLRVTQLV